MKQVGILVLNYNGMKFINDLYPSLLAQTYKDFDIIVVDNASTDDSIAQIKINFPSVIIMQFSQNYGFAKAFNYAAKKHPYEFLLFLNNDVYVEPTWLEELMRAIGRNDKIFMANCKNLYWEYPEFINSAGGSLTFLGSGMQLGNYEKLAEYKDKERYVGMAQGCAMLVRRNIFLKIGGFDNNYFLLGEEADICWRAWLLGFPTIYTPKAILYHYGAYSIKRKTWFFIEFQVTKNRYMTLLKNSDTANLLQAIVSSIIYDVFNIWQRRSLDEIKAVVMSYGNILKNIKKILQKRISIQKNRRFSDGKLVGWGFFNDFRDTLSKPQKRRQFLDLMNKTKQNQKSF